MFTQIKEMTRYTYTVYTTNTNRVPVELEKNGRALAKQIEIMRTTFCLPNYTTYDRFGKW